jgi:hypothetical protein
MPTPEPPTLEPPTATFTELPSLTATFTETPSPTLTLTETATPTATASLTATEPEEPQPEETEPFIPRPVEIPIEDDSAGFAGLNAAQSVETLEETHIIDFDGQGSYSLSGCAVGTGRSGAGWQCNRPSASGPHTATLSFSPQCNVSYVSFDFRSADVSGYPHVAVSLYTLTPQVAYWYSSGGYPAQTSWTTIRGYDGLLSPRYVDTFYIYLGFNQSWGYGNMYIDNIHYRCMPGSTQPEMPSASPIIDFDGQGTFAPFRCGIGDGRENAQGSPTAGCIVKYLT